MLYSWSEAPSTYIAEDCLVYPQWERTCLILEKLEAPGKIDAWWGDRVGNPLSKASLRRNGLRNCGKGDWAGKQCWNVNK